MFGEYLILLMTLGLSLWKKPLVLVFWKFSKLENLLFYFFLNPKKLMVFIKELVGNHYVMEGYFYMFLFIENHGYLS
jgi:hypothetical protein